MPALFNRIVALPFTEIIIQSAARPCTGAQCDKKAGKDTGCAYVSLPAFFHADRILLWTIRPDFFRAFITNSVVARAFIA